MSTSADAARLSGLALVATGAVLWGTAGVAAKALYAVHPIDPVWVGFARLALAAPVMLLLAVLLLGTGALRFERADLPAVAALGIAQATYQGLYFGAVASVGVTLATLVALCSAPVLIAILAAVFLGERPTRTLLVAIALAVAGVGLLVGVPPEGAVADTGALLPGLGLAAGAALAYAVFALASRRLAPTHHPFALIGIGFGVGALLLAPFALALPAPTPDAATLPFLVYLGLVPTALAYALFFRGMRTVTAGASGVIVLAEPLTAALLAWALFAERLGPLGIAGAALLLGAAMAIVRSRGDKPR